MKPKTKGSKASVPAKEAARYRLRLFVAGKEPNSQLARENLTRLVAGALKDNCELEIVDVLKDSQTARALNVLVTPALVAESSGTRVTVFGTLADTHKVLAALRLPSSPP